MQTDSPLDEDLDLIYHHDGGVGLLEPFLLVIIVGPIIYLIWLITYNIIWPFIILILATYFFWYAMMKEKSSYKIYQDRIEFFNKNSQNQIEFINNDDIIQIRYDDEFGKDYENSAWLIFIYLKENHSSQSKKIKDNKIEILIKNKNKVDRIIKILKFYKSQNKQIYIQTKFKKINEALKMRNYDNP